MSPLRDLVSDVRQSVINVASGLGCRHGLSNFLLQWSQSLTLKLLQDQPVTPRPDVPVTVCVSLPPRTLTRIVAGTVYPES